MRLLSRIITRICAWIVCHACLDLHAWRDDKGEVRIVLSANGRFVIQTTLPKG